MAPLARSLLLVLVAVILAAQHASAGKSPSLNGGITRLPRQKVPNSFSIDRMVIVLYETLSDASSNLIRLPESTDPGSRILYTTPLWLTSSGTVVGTHNFQSTYLWEDSVMAYSNINIAQKGTITSSGAARWGTNVTRLAVTGATGIFTGWQGGLFLYGIGGSFAESQDGMILLKLFKPVA